MGLSLNVRTYLFKINECPNFQEQADAWGELSTTYLGLPLGAGIKSKDVWKPLLDKFRQRLALWKHKYLAKGGHLLKFTWLAY